MAREKHWEHTSSQQGDHFIGRHQHRFPMHHEISKTSIHKNAAKFKYHIYLTISRNPKLWTCRLSITRTKNKSKTPGYKPRPIHYYKTELLTTGKPNIFGKNYIDCHKWGLDDNTHARIQEMQWWFIMQKASLLENTRELINITRN